MAGYAAVFAAAAAVTYFLTPVVRALAVRVGAVVQPGERRVHTQPLPTLGGVAMYIGFLGGMAVASVDPQFRERVVDTVCILLPDVLKRDVAGAGEGTTLMEDLGMSSTGALEIVLLLEENLEVEISVEDLGRSPDSSSSRPTSGRSSR